MKYAFVKDGFYELTDAKISIAERGFKFGDGIFETIRVQDIKLQDWDLHLLRLESGLNDIKINFDVESLEEIANELLQKNQLSNGFVRISISRGIGNIGYLPLEDMDPTLVIETLPKREIDNSPKKIIISSYQKISNKSLPVTAKLSNGLNSTLALMEAREQGYFDGLLLNEKNEICETSSANIFFTQQKKIITPSLASGLVAGVMREKIMKRYNVKEKILKLDELDNFDGCFITNISWQYMPVRQIDGDDKKYSFKLKFASLDAIC